MVGLAHGCAGYAALEDRIRLSMEADMAMIHSHHEDTNDLSGQALDLVILFGAISLFVGAIAAFVVLAT